MPTIFPDTHPKIEALQIQLWRQASPTRKMHMMAQRNASARLLLGEELARKVCGEISHATEMHFEGNGIEHPHPDYPTSQLSD